LGSRGRWISEFQDSQGYTEKSCVEKQKQKQKQKHKQKNKKQTNKKELVVFIFNEER
jgi:Sec-independent protein translocase protein TatA